jgi:DNA-binding response OmpR family regulator
MSGARQVAGQAVLIVDGDELVRRTLTAILHGSGFPVVAATDGDQAGEIFKRHAPRLALIVVEVVLPKVSGTEFVQRLPTRVPRVPVLFITGMGEYEIPHDVRQIPVLRKPFEAKTLIAAVRALISSE